MIVILLEIVLGLVFTYLFYTGVVQMYMRVNYYKKQGIEFIPGMMPVIGNLLQIVEAKKNLPPQFNPMIELGNYHYKGYTPSVYGFAF